MSHLGFQKDGKSKHLPEGCTIENHPERWKIINLPEGWKIENQSWKIIKYSRKIEYYKIFHKDGKL